MHKMIHTIALTAVLGIGTAALVSPVRAAGEPSVTVLKSAASNHVMFRNDVFVKTENNVLAALDQQVKQYTEGEQTGLTPEGLAIVEVNGETVYVPVSALASTQESIAELKEQKAQEERKAAQAKAEKEKAAKAEKDAAKKAAREAEEEAVKVIGDEENETPEAQEEPAVEEEPAVQEAQEEAADVYAWNGPVLSPSAGTVQGPSGKETYYNLPMEGVVSIMRGMGNNDTYWVREDGVKMLGDYVIVAANLNIRPRGSIVPTSLGLGIVCDTGGFASANATQLDIAVAW